MSSGKRNGKQLRFGDIQPIAHARVPIVKFKELETGVEVDVCINNMLATRNTLLLQTYANIDVRVRQLGVIIKVWSKARGTFVVFGHLVNAFLIF